MALWIRSTILRCRLLPEVFLPYVFFLILSRRLGGKDNGGPGIRKEMSRQPYYSAFVYDPEGNNLEAVNVRR